jgi:hypothetical protein
MFGNATHIRLIILLFIFVEYLKEVSPNEIVIKITGLVENWLGLNLHNI